MSAELKEGAASSRPSDNLNSSKTIPKILDEGGLNIPFDELKSMPPFKKFKLISVNFKEAALDSPSFRACVNHLDNQILKIERWLVALVSSVKKIPKYAKELQTFCNSFLEHLVPAFLQDGLIDQEYTIQSLQTTLKGLKQLWGMSLSSLNVDTYVIENLNMIVSKNLGQYKEIRKAFDVNQTKHDRYLELYLSTPKTKDPVSTVEDAKQVFQVRKDYIHSSLDLVVELSSIGSLLDKVLVGLSTDLWKNKRSLFTSDSNSSNLFRESWIKIQRIQSWYDSYSIAIEKLGSDMLTARNQVEEASLYQFKPSTNPNEYKSLLINQHTLEAVDEQGVEKHGYLFMKTWTDKSSKPIWVRRWAFVKGGIFGLLILSASQTFVQETDKLGILLCNVRYNPNEDRRFCFELKTSDLTVVFQAETLLELKSWLKVFQNERNRILGSGSRDNELFNIASGRYPPVIAEFSSSAPTVIDRELTSSKIVHHSSGQIITPSNLSKHIERNDKMFSKYVYNQIIQIKPPFITDTTKSSILSYSLVSATSVPTALTANIWGSVNWGMYYIHSSVRDDSVIGTSLVQQDHELIKLQQQEREYGIYYPPYYPKELVPLDIQLRSLFDTAIEPGEYCLLSYRCLWSPNSRQELSGRCFITINHVYIYMQALGFVSLTKGYVGRLVAVDCKRSRQFDTVKMYGVSGIIKIKLFLDDGFAMKQKMNYLIENKICDTPKLMKDIIPEFQKIDELLEQEKAEQTGKTTSEPVVREPSKSQVPEFLVTRPDIERAISEPGSGSLNGLTRKNDSKSTLDKSDLSPVVPILPLNDPALEPITKNGMAKYKNQVKKALFQVARNDPLSSFADTPTSRATEYRIDFSDEYRFIMDKTYSIPPKALFHSLLGDKSYVLEELNPFGVVESVVKKPWSTTEDGKLSRVFNTVANYDKKRWVVRINQAIDNLVDNEYYTFNHSRSNLMFRFGSTFSVNYKCVLLKVLGEKTRLLLFFRIDFKTRSIFNPLVYSLSERISRNNCVLLHNRVKASVKEIGTHGPIVKSIYLYGKLSLDKSGDDLTASKNELDDVDLPFIKVNLFQVCKVILRRKLFSIVGFFIQSIQLFFNGGIALFQALSMQQFLLFVILISTILNLFLAGKTTTTYWTVRRANQIAYDYVTKDPLRLERAIYSKDTEDLLLQRFHWTNHEWLSPDIRANHSEICFNTFKNSSFILHYKEPTYWDDIYGDVATKQVAKEIKKSFQEVGTRRHKLLVDLEILNGLEEKLARAEWRNWLWNEVQRCELVSDSVLTQLLVSTEEGGPENVSLGVNSILNYCQDCNNELKYIDML